MLWNGPCVNDEHALCHMYACMYVCAHRVWRYKVMNMNTNMHACMYAKCTIKSAMTPSMQSFTRHYYCRHYYAAAFGLPFPSHLSAVIDARAVSEHTLGPLSLFRDAPSLILCRFNPAQLDSAIVDARHPNRRKQAFGDEYMDCCFITQVWTKCAIVLTVMGA